MTYPLFDNAADTNIEQGKLFSAKDLAGTYHVHQPQHHITIDQDAIGLNQWKQRVLAYQQTHHQATPSTQGSLFNLLDLSRWCCMSAKLSNRNLVGKVFTIASAIFYIINKPTTIWTLQPNWASHSGKMHPPIPDLDNA